MDTLVERKHIILTETAYEFLVGAAKDAGVSLEGFLELLVSRTEGLKAAYPESYTAFLQTPLE